MSRILNVPIVAIDCMAPFFKDAKKVNHFIDYLHGATKTVVYIFVADSNASMIDQDNFAYAMRDACHGHVVRAWGIAKKYEPDMVISHKQSVIDSVSGARSILLTDAKLKKNKETSEWDRIKPELDAYLEESPLMIDQLNDDWELVLEKVRDRYFELILPQEKDLGETLNTLRDQGSLYEAIELRDITFETFIDNYDIIAYCQNYVCLSYPIDDCERIEAIFDDLGYELTDVEIGLGHGILTFTSAYLPLLKR